MLSSAKLKNKLGISPTSGPSGLTKTPTNGPTKDRASEFCSDYIRESESNCSIIGDVKVIQMHKGRDKSFKMRPSESITSSYQDKTSSVQSPATNYADE